MKIKSLVVAVFAVAVGIFCHSPTLAAAEKNAAFPERQTRRAGKFTIEYSVGDEKYADALAARLAEEKPPVLAVAATERLTLDVLEKKRSHFLGKLAAAIGLKEPTDGMKSNYDLVVKLLRGAMAGAPKELPRHYALWRKPELISRMDAGEKISGFSKDSSGTLSFDFKFKSDDKHDGQIGKAVVAQMTEWWGKFVFPIKIGADPDQTPAQEVLAGLETATGVLMTMHEYMRGNQRLWIFFVLHETAESGVVWHYLNSKDRRWFCDGIANYVAWKVIRDELGDEAAKEYYDLPAELKKFAAEADRVDLPAWPASENLKQGNYSENLNTANYAFATKVIADVIAKHGDDLLPKLFKLVGRTPREKATMDTVYEAFKELTGEDLRSYLPKPAPKN